MLIRIVASILLISLLVSAGVSDAKLPSQLSSLAFTHITIIDATGALAQPDMTVVIEGNQIASLGKTGKIRVPENTQVINGTGKFLIPGLWDMHAHPFLLSGILSPKLLFNLY